MKAQHHTHTHTIDILPTRCLSAHPPPHTHEHGNAAVSRGPNARPARHEPRERSVDALGAIIQDMPLVAEGGTSGVESRDVEAHLAISISRSGGASDQAIKPRANLSVN